MGLMDKVVGYIKREIQETADYYKGQQKVQNIDKEDKLTVSKDVITTVENREEQDVQKNGDYIVYYRFGHVERVVPEPPGSYYDNRDIIYSATSIVSDGVSYNLSDKKSIYSIAIPQYSAYGSGKIGQELGVTGTLDYVLRMRAGRYWTEKKYDLSIYCLEKATQLMLYSDIGWPKKDFYRIVNDLRDLGQLKKANKWKEWIERNVPDPVETVTKNTFDSCKFLETDLVEVGSVKACCEKCAMYRNRVYSLSGKDKRSPRFPKDFHMDCGLRPWAFVYGVNEPSFECTDVILFSNRPFVDDRSSEEITAREELLAKLQKQSSFERQPDIARITYYRLGMLLPDDVPKSMSGFLRMRNANSKRYQELVKKAEEAGFVFPQTLADVEKWEGT